MENTNNPLIPAEENAENSTPVSPDTTNTPEPEALAETPVAEMEQTPEETPAPVVATEEIKENQLPVVETLPHIEEIEEEEDLMELEEKYNQMTREELSSELATILEHESIAHSKSKVGLIRISFKKLNDVLVNEAKAKFLEEGGLEEEFQYTPDSVEEEFNNTFKKYKDIRREEENRLEKEREENLKAKQDILEELKQLISSEETLKKTYDEFKTLQERWKQVGPVPPKELNNLWQSYHHYVERFFDFVKLNKEMKDLDLRKNMEIKLELCEKAEELLLEPSIKKSFKKLQEYHNMWREAGPVPAEKKEEIWERFKLTSDALNKRRKEFYDKLQEERERNLEQKNVLCEKIEQITAVIPQNSKEWEDKANEIAEIQKAWKSIGFAPKKFNDEIWHRFKAANDKFFQNRTEFYKKLKGDRIDNLNRKLEICLLAEGLQESTDWKQTTAEYLRLQEEWKKIGPVPSKHSDKIWKRFRGACDNFFNNKSKFFSNIDGQQETNQKLKEELIAAVENFIFSETNEDNLSALKDFQRRWTEIGHVPIKVKDALYKRFRAAIDKHFENLKLSENERHNMKFRNRFENLRENNDGNKIINQERRFLVNKITALKNDIAIWENNIGFFANSKGGDALREEYVNKIEKAKEQIKTMEDKLNILDNVQND